jgi:dipeptidyl aminopeptidase/acylaminoacyl peptidase
MDQDGLGHRLKFAFKLLSSSTAFLICRCSSTHQSFRRTSRRSSAVRSKQSEAIWQAASPANHVSAAAAPFLLLHGTADMTVPYSQSAEMQRRLRAAGVKADLFTADGAAHGFFNQPPWFDSTIAAIADFLRSVLP